MIGHRVGYIVDVEKAELLRRADIKSSTLLIDHTAAWGSAVGKCVLMPSTTIEHQQAAIAAKIHPPYRIL